MTIDDKSAPGVGAANKAVVWDLPVRLVHWALVGLVACQWWTAENNMMGLHRQTGMAVLALIVFRIYWGFAGTPTARFAQFVKGPGAILRYLKTLRRPYRPTFGHNPVGALSVVAMLAALSVQVGSGLFAVDVDGIESGPLSHLVSFDAGRQLAEIHDASFNVLIALIVLHVVAVLFYWVALRANLIGAMVSGRRTIVDEEKPAVAQPTPWLRICAGVVFAGAVVCFIQN